MAGRQIVHSGNERGPVSATLAAVKAAAGAPAGIRPPVREVQVAT